MKPSAITLTLIFACLASGCANKKWGSYTILHTHEFGDGYKAILLESENGIRLNVEQNGIQIAETEVDETEVRMVTSPYRTVSSEESLDSMTMFSDGETITFTRWMSDEDKKHFILDQDGDGFPEKRATMTESEPIIERIEPLSTVTSRCDKVEPDERGQ